MKGYEYMAQMFKAYGVTHVFYMDAMLRMVQAEMEKLGIESYLAHSENAAAYMADGYARATGKPGIVCSQSIGSGNLAAGLYDAYLSNSPVIAFTGKKVPYLQYKNAYQEVEYQSMYESVTKFRAEIAHANQLSHLLRQSFREVTTGKTKPAHLSVAGHLGRQIEEADIDEPICAERAYMKTPVYRPAAEDNIVMEAVAAIKAAKKPIIVAGRGALISGAQKEIYELASLNDIPIITTPDGKCVVDETDALWAGCCGNYGMDCANVTLRCSDLVIFVGTQASDQTTLDWTAPTKDTQVIQIDIDAAEIGRCYSNTIGLLGDAKTIVKQLVNATEKARRLEWRNEVAGYVKRTLDEYKVFQESGSTPIRPERLCHELSKVLPDNAVVVADTGYSAQWTTMMLRLKTTHRYFRAGGSLGWSFPASMGVKLGLPDNPVICFAGDGAMYYHIGEMETMARKGIKTVTVVNNNQVLAQCAVDLKNVYAKVHGDANKAKHRYTFTPVLFSELAKSFGLNGVVVERPEDIGPAIVKALAEDKSTVIDVMTYSDVTVPSPIR